MDRFARTAGALFVGVFVGAIFVAVDLICGEPILGPTGALWSGFVVLCYVVAAGMVLDFIAFLRRRN